MAHLAAIAALALVLASCSAVPEPGTHPPAVAERPVPSTLAPESTTREMGSDTTTTSLMDETPPPPPRVTITVTETVTVSDGDTP